MADAKISVIAPPKLVKSLKVALEANGCLDRAHKITTIADIPPRCWLQTTISVPGDVDETELLRTKKRWLVNAAQIDPDSPEVSLTSTAQSAVDTGRSRSEGKSIVVRVVRQWLSRVPSATIRSVGASVDQLCESFPKSYSLYPPMLLLPEAVLTARPLEKLHPLLDPGLSRALWGSLATAFDAKIVALHGHIPLLEADGATLNIIRSPTRIQALYGDLGPLTTTAPTVADFADAVWVHTKQNGIHQTWAPRYTMFSRGNIKEKARILNLPSVVDNTDSTAVDLYAGIGYFSFSYAKAGVSQVLCWDINPWSVEALVRGAAENGWSVTAHREGDREEDVFENANARMTVFQEDNAKALSRISEARSSLPPVRHVNCGMLPTSEQIWRDAVHILDINGGWIHAHEIIATKHEETRVDEITRMIQAFAGTDRDARCEHVERVKSYAPGVMHCVLDIHVGTKPPM